MRPELAPLVRSITVGTGEGAEAGPQCLLPSGRASLWVILNRDEFRYAGGTVAGAFVYGPEDHASVVEIEPGRVHVCVDFTPAGAAAFFPVPLAELRNRAIGLPELWGRDGACLRERVLQAQDGIGVVAGLLAERLTGTPDPAICQAAAWLEAGASVAEVTERLGLLPRTFRRRFVARVGLTPKRYARVCRLQRAVHAAAECTEPEWSLIAAQHGFCDQAHLVDEFGSLVGVTPGEYLSRRMDGPNHLRLA